VENDITADSYISFYEGGVALEMPVEALVALTGPGPFCAMLAA
jgi:hypothetical protein